MLEKLIERGKTMAVLFYDINDEEDHLIMDELEKIDDDCRRSLRFLFIYILIKLFLAYFFQV